MGQIKSAIEIALEKTMGVTVDKQSLEADTYKKQGKKILLSACDTFRAAAIDQLQIWADRLKVDIVKHNYGADAGAVAYDSLEAALSRGMDYLIIDTAGRLHTNVNLMEELKKSGVFWNENFPALLMKRFLCLTQQQGRML